MKRETKFIVAGALALASTFGALVTTIFAKFAVWPMMLCAILAVLAAVIVPKNRLKPCAFCSKPSEEAYCDDRCLHAHVDEALKKHNAAQRRPFPPPDKHGPYCCCIYC